MNVRTTAPDRALLAGRTLQLAQCIDVGRLTSHPVWIRAGGLVAVTGLGPTDSNETGKTTWLAAITLLTGDHGWDLASGTSGQNAAQLLFDPPEGDSSARANHGYVIGVFGPDAAQLPTGDGAHFTVWLRINRSSPFLHFRLAPGVLLAQGDSHTDRIAEADRLWAGLPNQTTLGPLQYLRDVLGDVPRSTGYVSDRGGRQARRTSLLTTMLSDLTPTEIGDELIDLAGLRPRLRAERDARRTAAEQADKVEAARRAVEQEGHNVDAQLEAMRAREDALANLTEATAFRDAYVAAQVRELLVRRRQLAQRHAAILTSAPTRDLEGRIRDAHAEVERTADHSALENDRATAHAAWTDLDDAVRPLREQARILEVKLQQLEKALREGRLRLADDHRGRDSTTVEDDLQDARNRAAEAAVAARQAAEELTRARLHVDDIMAGRASSRAAIELGTAGIDADVLGDNVEPTAEARDRWDPALATWADAILVADSDLGDAIATLRGMPGTVLIGGDPDDGAALPDGIASARPLARRWLHRLETTLTTHNEPPAAVTVLDDVTVIGGFTHPLIGRHARIAAAEQIVVEAETRHAKIADEATARAQRTAELEREHAAAVAHEEREQLRQDRTATVTELADTRLKLRELEPSLDGAARRLNDAKVAVEVSAERHRAAQSELDALRSRWQVEVTQPLEDLERQARNDRLPWWVARFAAINPDEAPLLADGDLDGITIDESVADTLEQAATRRLAEAGMAGAKVETPRRRYSERIEDALRQLGIRVVTDASGDRRIDAHGDVPPPVQRAALARANSLEASNEDRVRTFDELVTTIHDVYGPMVANDQLRRQQIEQRLHRLQEELAAAEESHQAATSAAAHLQSSLEELVRTRLDRLAEAFRSQIAADDGVDADLLVTPVLPAEGEHDRLLRFDVVPQWARAPRGRLIDYRKPANLAQIKLKAVQLLLAALRTDDDPRGRILVLDELGAGLGARHRELVLRGLASVAERDGVTVLGTVQDDLQSDAFRHVHEVLVFRFRGAGSQLNDPTVALAAGPDARLRPVTELLVDGWPEGFEPALADHLAFSGTDEERGREPAPTIWDVPDHVPDGLLADDGNDEP